MSERCLIEFRDIFENGQSRVVGESPEMNKDLAVQAVKVINGNIKVLPAEQHMRAYIVEVPEKGL